MSPNVNPHDKFVARYLNRFPFVSEEDARRIACEAQPFRELSLSLAPVVAAGKVPTARQVRCALELASELCALDLRRITVERGSDSGGSFLIRPSVLIAFDDAAPPHVARTHNSCQRNQLDKGGYIEPVRKYE